MDRINYVRDEDGKLVDEREFSIEWTKWCKDCGEHLGNYVLEGTPEELCPDCKKHKESQTP